MISQITAAGREAGQRGEVAAGFGVAGAHQHAAVLRLQREDVAGLDQVGRPASRATAACMVRARSAAEMPVVTPVAASIDTVKVVPCWAPLLAIIGGSCRRSQRSRVSVRQIRPRPWRAMKLIASGVTCRPP